MWEYAAAWKHPLPLPSSTHLPQKHQTSLKGMAAWPCSGEHEFFSKKILPNPDSSIYFLPHGRRKAPVIQSGCSSGVERNLAKVDVVGSNPIIRSIFLSEACPSRAGFFITRTIRPPPEFRQKEKPEQTRPFFVLTRISIRNRPRKQKIELRQWHRPNGINCATFYFFDFYSVPDIFVSFHIQQILNIL